MKKWFAGAVAVLPALVILPSTVSAQDAIPVLEAASSPAERDRVEKLIEEARKEGVLEWAGVFIEPKQAQYIQEEFKKYYGLPDLRMEYSFVGSGALSAQVEQLIKADRNNFDIVWASAWSWFKDLHGRGELLEYDSPYYAEYTLSKDAGMSLDGYWASDARTYQPMYNATVLAERGVTDFDPTSWNDFLDPRLAGMVSLGDVHQSFSFAQSAESIRKTVGEDWFKKLADTVKPVFFSKTAQGRGWVASGEFPIMLMSHGKNAQVLKDQNIDVKLVFPEEGILLMPDTPVILKRAPHPAVARLFIDFVRSAHGAQTVQKSGAELFFGRPGVKSSDPQLFPAWEDVKAIPMDWNVEGTVEQIESIRKIVKDAGIGRS